MFYKYFDKEPQPFGSAFSDIKLFTYGTKSRSYELRSLPYRVIADRFAEYKADGNVESAVKCCHTRRIISKSLKHEEDLGAMADLCEIALE
jgi:hypothetical protein